MSDINNTIIGQSFRDSARSQDANGFDVELTGDPDAGQGTKAFTSDVVDGDFEPVVPAKRRPIKLILAGVFSVSVLLAGGAAYTASIMQKPKASDIDFGAIKRASPTQVAAVAVAPALGEQAATAPTTDTSVVAPAVLPPPAIGAAPAPIAVASPPTPPALPVPGVAPAPLPVAVAVPPAGQGVPAVPTAPTPAIAKPAVPAAGTPPALAAAAHPQSEAAKLAASPPKPSVPPTAKPPVPPVAKAAVGLPAKPVVKPVVARPVPLAAAKQPAPVKLVVAAKSVPAKPQLAKVVAPQPQPIHADDSNPLGADVRPLVTVTAEQIGMRAMSAEAISLATAAGVQRFKVGDYLPSGDRVMHIDPPGSTLVTDKKIIRVVN